MSAEIVPLAESYFEGLRDALDIVAREKRYLAFIQAPPPEQAYAFYRNILANDLCLYVAIQDGAVVGWCDILPTNGEARAHIGILGMGLVPFARGRGIGQTLLQTTLVKAWAKGLSRIELTVRTDNSNAKALYERMGFKTEGLNERALLIDGTSYDTYSMALLR
ncbi:MAG: GNAT family N-acetyltransferase [Betaproteobacteria bacterium]|nr:GNAT family N-acetyltransferase [Betaproteobacteria bacterium]